MNARLLLPRASAGLVMVMVAPLATGAQDVDAALAWTTFTSPASGASLAAIDARSSSDVWAVGLRPGGTCSYHTLIQHFDGSSWRVVPSPNVKGNNNTVLTDVAALSANDAWAVGSSGCAIERIHPVAEHWDGARWAIVPTPSPGSFDLLSTVAAVSSTDVWALGSTQRARWKTLAEHWDGTSWSVVPSPSVTPLDQLVAASASTSDDVWAVGSGPAGRFDMPIALHWDGTSWQAVPVPTPDDLPGFLAGVFARSASDAWAVGGYRPGDGSVRPLALHWDGRHWRATSVSLAGSSAVLDSVSGTAGGALWAAGSQTDANGTRALVLHFEAASWVVEDPPATTTDVRDLSVLPGRELWGVSGADVLHGVPSPQRQP
jgi:hypothetical protein